MEARMKALLRAHRAARRVAVLVSPSAALARRDPVVARTHGVLGERVNEIAPKFNASRTTTR